VKLFTCELGFKKFNGVQFKFLNQKFHSVKASHIPPTKMRPCRTDIFTQHVRGSDLTMKSPSGASGIDARRGAPWAFSSEGASAAAVTCWANA
jgi:hypothetical protein